MATQKNKNKNKDKEITALSNHLDECPFFDIKHLEHKSLDGFIKHPENFYLKSRYMSLSSRSEPETSKFTRKSYAAFSFSSRHYRIPGSVIEVSIATVNESHQILGKVIASIQSKYGYEVGMVLMNKEDGIKLRYIEQICFIDDKLLSSIV